MSINISELIWTVICFFVLLVVLKKLLFDPLVSFMAARDARIQDGLNAGRTAQRIYAQAGVIGDGGQTACLADGFSLDEGVLGKGGAGLLHVYGDSHVCGAHHFHPQSGEDIRHLLQLTGVMGRQHEFHTVSSFSAARSRRLFRMVSTRSMVTMVISRM